MGSGFDRDTLSAELEQYSTVSTLRSKRKTLRCLGLPGEFAPGLLFIHRRCPLKDERVSGNEHRYKDDVRFSYDNVSRKVTVYLKNNSEVMLNDMAFMLGFSPRQIIRPPRATNEWIWNAAFTIFWLTVTLFNHIMLAMH